MKGNIPIPELPFNEEVWLMVAVTSVRERRTQQGKPFRDVSARNATGSLALNIAAEEERVYQLGSLNATSGRILSIAVHVGPVPGFEIEGLTSKQSEHAFGIDKEGNDKGEAQALKDFIALMSDFDVECDELVGHNIIGFDLPFIFQRCLANNMAARPFVNLGEYNVRGVFDTMRAWWLGDRRSRVSLDDIAWTLGLESSKTADVEGSRVFDLYQAGKLLEIREYNLNDVRVTRKVYERMVAAFGR